ncbi:unnamed protein product [Sphagnum tenellum]
MQQIVNVQQQATSTAQQLATGVLQANQPTPVATPAKFKLPDPKPFSGKISETIHFLESVDTKFSAEAALYNSEEQKILSVQAWTTRATFELVRHTIKQASSTNTPLIWTALRQRLLEVFPPEDESKTSRRKMEKLRQTGSCTHYVAVFVQLQVATKYPEDVLIEKFEQGSFRILPSKHDVVLPLKWLETHDPDILWREHQVHFTSETCRKHCLVAEQDAVRLCPETFEPLETPEHSEHPEHLDAEHVHGDTIVSSPSQHPRSIGPANPSDLEENATSTGNEQLTSDAEPANNSTESRTTSRPGRQETLLPEILNLEFMKLLDNPDLPGRIAYRAQNVAGRRMRLGKD